MTVFASETGAVTGGTEAEGSEALQASETEAETEAETQPAGLEPKETTGDPGWEAQYPALEAQVEQQLTTLSAMGTEQLEQLITTYNKEINLGVRDIANSMKDSSALTDQDDTTMATVKMLRNWYSMKDSCGEFQGVEEYTADMTDNVITLDLVAKYAQALKDNATVNVKFTYDLNRNVSLMRWDLTDSFQTSIKRAALNTVIGLGTVFIVLMFLAFVIGQIHWVPDILDGKKKSKEAAEAAARTAAPAPAPAVQEVEEAAEETDDLELVAVITAAIAASEQAPADGFVVRSIRRRGRKSNWRA
jgi:sodium pump decarboxylase gamma subunit